ncbi:hypothetical protein EJB05_52672, partial [Eragrostis curvula]
VKDGEDSVSEEPQCVSACGRASVEEDMSVDLKRGENLPIHINMSFPSLPCEVLSVDAIDMSGKHEVDLHTNIWKLRLDRYGHIIGTEYLSDLVEKEHGAHNHVETDHGHERHDEAKKHEHTFDEDAEKMVKSVKQALANGEGCRVYGHLDVQRVAGNFHVSVHGLNIFVAEKIFEGSSHVNVSHVIHELSFGPKYPGIHNPLDDTTRILHDASGTFKYYIKVSCYCYIQRVHVLLFMAPLWFAVGSATACGSPNRAAAEVRTYRR